jgi:hypothetical protein
LLLLTRRAGRLEQARRDVHGARDRGALELDALQIRAGHVQRTGRGEYDDR